MMAHVTYPSIDARAAGYSRIWIEDVLRGELGFRGIVIGDDIGMAAAEGMGSIAARIEGHLLAGCDLLLACSPSIVDEAIAASAHATPCGAERLASLQGAVAQTWDALADNPQRDEFIARLAALDTQSIAQG
jgi:beta-N-acetylhexosaminidase